MATSKDLQNNKLQHKDKYNNGALKGENEMNQAMKLVMEHLKSIYPYEFSHESSITLSKIIEESLPEYKNFLHCESTSSRAQPDGGIIYLHIGNYKFPILMAENKLQGTIDKLAKQGKKQIAQGNAIERLGKNVLLFQTYLKRRKEIAHYSCLLVSVFYTFKMLEIFKKSHLVHSCALEFL